MNLLYLSDVFCPWCYGFGPVMQRILAAHPDLSVRVLAGNLMDEPLTLSEMKEDHPSIREFFVRLEKTTGQSVEAFLLRSGRSRLRRPRLAHVFSGKPAFLLRR